MQHLSTTMTCIFLRLSMIRIFPKGINHAKKIKNEKIKNHFQRSIGPPNTLPREMNVIYTNKDPVEGSNIKLPFARRGPPKLIFPFPSHSNGIQQSVEGSQDIHFPIMSPLNKANIPLKGNPSEPQQTHPFHEQCHINLGILP
jgi:hypothetical protein